VSKLPSISGKTAVKAFEKMGYRIIRTRGSHFRLHHINSKKNPLTIPNHKTLGRGLLRKLIRDAEITIEDFTELLK